MKSRCEIYQSVYTVEGFHRFMYKKTVQTSTPRDVESALDEVADNHSWYPPSVSSDSKGKTAINESLFHGLVLLFSLPLRGTTCGNLDDAKEGRRYRPATDALLMTGVTEPRLSSGLYRRTQDVRTAFWLESKATCPYFYIKSLEQKEPTERSRKKSSVPPNNSPPTPLP